MWIVCFSYGEILFYIKRRRIKWIHVKLYTLSQNWMATNGYIFFIYEWLHFLAEQIHLQARIYEFLVGGGLVFKKVLKN